MKALDRIVLAVDRRLNRKDLGVPPPVPFCGQGGYEAPEPSVLPHTGAHSALTGRRRRGTPGPAKTVATVAAAILLPAAGFFAGMEYAGERADERVAETEASYQRQMSEQAAVAVYDARDVCAARVAPGGERELVWARVFGEPRLEACHAEQLSDAARIRAEAKDRSFRSGP